MNLILLGAPGAGKGTQAEYITSRFGIPALSTGGILREAVRNQTEVGLRAKGYMDAGELVPDEVIIAVIAERMKEPDAQNGFILDGVPRTVAQAEALEEMGVRIDSALDIEVPDEVIVKRLSGRRVCEACGATFHTQYKPSAKANICDKCGAPLSIRKDDEPETILARLDTYHKQTEPLIAFYTERGKLVEVDGTDSVDAIRAKIESILETLP